MAVSTATCLTDGSLQVQGLHERLPHRLLEERGKTVRTVVICWSLAETFLLSHASHCHYVVLFFQFFTISFLYSISSSISVSSAYSWLSLFVFSFCSFLSIPFLISYLFPLLPSFLLFIRVLSSCLFYPPSFCCYCCCCCCCVFDYHFLGDVFQFFCVVLFSAFPRLLHAPCPW